MPVPPPPHLRHFDATRYANHFGLKFSKPRDAQHHYLQHLKAGRFVLNRHPNHFRYELVNWLVEHPERLEDVVQQVDRLLEGKTMAIGEMSSENIEKVPGGAKGEACPLLQYIQAAWGATDSREQLLNTIEAALAARDPGVGVNSRYQYSDSNTVYWWWSRPDRTSQPVAMTVALPILNNSRLVWLPLESLARQRGVDFAWELIVYEEDGLSRATIQQYADRLPGCVRIVHRNIRPGDGMFPPGYTLLEKWVNIARLASQESSILVALASDCYSPSDRLRGHYLDFKAGCHFSKRSRGYFYHIGLDRYAYFDVTQYRDMESKTRQGLDYSVGIDFIRAIKLPPYPTFKGIDNFFTSQLNLETIRVAYYDVRFPESRLDGLDTDGLNNISLGRTRHYLKQTLRHMYPTASPGNLTVPGEVMLRLRGLKSQSRGGCEQKS